MANKISVLIDVAADKAVSGLKGFKQSINDADGAVGKMQAGAKSAFGAIQQHAAAMALAVGAALVTFGAKGVVAFTNLALEAGKFRDVSGATLDEASRWIAVGDDIGVSGDSISAAWNKMNIAIGSGKPLLELYGITLKKTADGQADANATFLNAINVINGIKDPTKRAELAAATFGKGWTSMSELIDQGAGTIATAMGKVSDAQIIDDGELAKAKQYRESMDKLSDSVKDVAMDVGEGLTPAIAVAAEVLSELAPLAGKVAGSVSDAFVGMSDSAYELGKTLAEMADALPFVEVAGLADGIEHTTYEFTKLERFVHENIAAWQEGVPTMEAFRAKLEALGYSQDTINLAMAASKFSLNENKAATDELTGATHDLSEATDVVAEVTDAYTLRTDMASFALEAKKRADEEAADAAKEHAEAMEDAAEAYVENFEAANTWVDELGSAMDTAGGAISDFSDEALADIDTFQQELADNTAAMADWQTNLITIAGETSDEFATYLATLGPEAAKMVADLAGNTGELETTFDQWKLASAVTGRDMVAEFAKVSPQTEAEFEQLGRNIASTLDGVGTLTSAEAVAVGKAISAGIASGIDFNAQIVATAAINAARNALKLTRNDQMMASPSKLWAEQVGKPIVWGIAQGMDDEEQKLAEAAQRAAEKLIDGFGKEIESSAKDALDAVDDMVDDVADRFDDMWDVVEGRRDIEGLTAGVADAETDLAEANQKVADAIAEFGPGSEQHLDALERVEDATDKLEDANYRLLKASQDLLDQGPAGVAAFAALAAAAGLEDAEISNLMRSYHLLKVARDEAATQTAAINAEAAAAQDVRARFGQAAASGQAKDWIDHIAQFANDPAFQLELMRQFLATLPNFAGGGIVPGPVGAPQLVVAHGGEAIGTNGNGHAPINVTVNAGMGANGQEIGDLIVGKIREYERRNGPGWRG